MSPDNNRDRISRDWVSRVKKSELYRNYAQAFQTTTGLPLGLRPVGSIQDTYLGCRMLNPFCSLMSKTSKSCSSCLQMQQSVEREAGPGQKTLKCFAGLSESLVPIRVGEQIMAYLQTGQVMFQRPTSAKFRSAARQILAWDPASDIQGMEEAYLKTRVVTPKQYESVLRLLTIFAQHLSTVGNQLMVQEAAAEAPSVSKARTFIAEHQADEISLNSVAHAVNMSVFYFCKVFKKATGLTFTEYLARVRVETIKQLLLDPHKRVSEAAYEAGFQSLSQFNRVFRRIAGEAPSAYRDRVHTRISTPPSRGVRMTYAA
jgi:AraC-like DNA-binding protein